MLPTMGMQKNDLKKTQTGKYILLSHDFISIVDLFCALENQKR